MGNVAKKDEFEINRFFKKHQKELNRYQPIFTTLFQILQQQHEQRQQPLSDQDILKISIHLKLLFEQLRPPSERNQFSGLEIEMEILNRYLTEMQVPNVIVVRIQTSYREELIDSQMLSGDYSDR
jgi:hypothetical protein